MSKKVSVATVEWSNRVEANDLPAVEEILRVLKGACAVHYRGERISTCHEEGFYFIEAFYSSGASIPIDGDVENLKPRFAGRVRSIQVLSIKTSAPLFPGCVAIGIELKKQSVVFMEQHNRKSYSGSSSTRRTKRARVRD